MDEIPSSPKVTALIVSQNCAPALRRCLAALEASAERERLDIVVVDNGSTDESPTLDAEFPHINLLRLPRHFGFTKAINIGIRSAKGAFVFFLTPETEVAPDTIPCLASRLEGSPDAVAVCPLLVSAGGTSVSRCRLLPVPSELYRAWRTGDFPDWEEPDLGVDALAVEYLKPPVLMARINFLKGMRHIDERYGHFGWDLEVCCQIRRASRKILLLPRVRVAQQSLETPEPADAAARALLCADRALGAAAFAAKHYGFFDGLALRLRSSLCALLGLLSFRDLGYHLSLLNFLLSGQKIDGSQRAL